MVLGEGYPDSVEGLNSNFELPDALPETAYELSQLLDQYVDTPESHIIFADQLAAMSPESQRNFGLITPALQRAMRKYSLLMSPDEGGYDAFKLRFAAARERLMQDSSSEN